MKLSLLFAMAALCVMPLTGCSDVDSPLDVNEEQQDPALLKKLSEGQESATYARESFTFYNLSYANDMGWVEQPSLPDGAIVPSPGSITIHNGCTWQPLSLSSSTGLPGPLSMPFYAYCRVTGFNKAFYVASPVEYDSVNGTFKMGKYTYDVESVTKETLKLVNIGEYQGGIDGKGGKHRFDLTFKRQELSLPDLDKILFFDSELEAKLTMLEMIREQFGDEFNLNDYLGGHIILDHPMVNLNEIEAGLKAGYLY